MNYRKNIKYLGIVILGGITISCGIFGLKNADTTVRTEPTNTAQIDLTTGAVSHESELTGKIKNIRYFGCMISQIEDTSKLGKIYREENLNPTGAIIERINFGFDEKMESREVYKYDANGNLIVQMSFAANDSLYNKIEWKYNKENLEILAIRTDFNRDTLENVAYEYDSYDNCVKIITKSNGLEEFIKTFEYTYEKDQIIELKSFILGKGLLRTQRVKYDVEGKQTEITMEEATGGMSKFTYVYDGNGNVVEQNNYATGGDLLKTTVVTYDEKWNKINRRKEITKGRSHYIAENGKWRLVEEEDKLIIDVIKYDIFGNLTEQTTIDTAANRNDKLVYEFDEFNNYIRMIQFKNDTLYSLNKRRIKYY